MFHQRDANGGTKTTFGVVENLEVGINGISVIVHAWIIDDPPYRLLLGRPFQIAAQADTEETGGVLVIKDPSNPEHRLRVPMRPHVTLHSPSSHFATADAPAYSAIALGRVTPKFRDTNPVLAQYFLPDFTSIPTSILGLKYKPVERKVRPVPTTMPEATRPKRRFPEDPLLSLPHISQHPLPITHFGQRLTKDRWEALRLKEMGFLWDEEINLAFQVLMQNEQALAWEDREKGCFWEDYFEPIIVPTIEHEPWTLKNIPIPHGIRNKVITFIREKIASGTYEPSGSSYRSRWFCVPKKNGTFHIVHDLQPLNSVTIKDAGVPPNIEPYAENAAGRVVYSMADLFTGFDHAPVTEESRDLFTFQTPLGPH